MPFVQLVHWNQAEARKHADLLRQAGQDVRDQMGDVRALLNDLRRDPPLAVVIDLTRLPSQGRDFAMAIRLYKDTRRVPLVMAGGDPTKLPRIRQQVPDAVYTSWENVLSGLADAIAHPPEDPIQPRSLLDGYSGKPLSQKLGIRPGSLVALVEAPTSFIGILGELPEGARLLNDLPASGTMEERIDMVVWFLRSTGDLQRCAAEMGRRKDFGSIWMAWPKKASGLGEGLVQQQIRDAGLAAGLVDYKVASIDPTWTGLLFTWRKAKKS